ncbi:MAG: NUDIX hydrolase [Candidatus Nanopelagicales bacterium]
MTEETARIPCVGGIVVDSGRILLVQRGQQPSLGLWSIPGGRLEPGETAEEGCAREVLEETGLRVEVGALVGTVERDAPGGGVYAIDDFFCRPTGEAREAVAGDDAADVRWCTADELLALDAAGLTAAGLLQALTDWHILDTLT